LEVFNEPDRDGKRGRLGFVAIDPVLNWFKDALDQNQNIHAGVDSTNQILVFRRRLSKYEYQSLRFSLQFERWSLEDDDTGFTYVEANGVEEEVSPTINLYSVDDTGAIFKLFGVEQPQLATMQGLINATQG